MTSNPQNKSKSSDCTKFDRFRFSVWNAVQSCFWVCPETRPHCGPQTVPKGPCGWFFFLKGPTKWFIMFVTFWFTVWTFTPSRRLRDLRVTSVAVFMRTSHWTPHWGAQKSTGPKNVNKHSVRLCVCVAHRLCVYRDALKLLDVI